MSKGEDFQSKLGRGSRSSYRALLQEARHGLAFMLEEYGVKPQDNIFERPKVGLEQQLANYVAMIYLHANGKADDFTLRQQTALVDSMLVAYQRTFEDNPADAVSIVQKVGNYIQQLASKKDKQPPVRRH